MRQRYIGYIYNDLELNVNVGYPSLPVHTLDKATGHWFHQTWVASIEPHAPGNPSLAYTSMALSSFSPEWGFKNSPLNASAKLCTKDLNISFIELSAPPLNSAMSSQQDPT